MNRTRHSLALVCLYLFATIALAQNIPLQNLDEGSLKKVTGDFSTNFQHTTVSGASSLGQIFGFELGVVGGKTATPHIAEVVHQADPNANADSIPDGAIVGLFSVPFGLTAEVGLVPKVGSQEFKFNSFSMAVKWTPTDVFLDLPLNLALRASLTRSHADFKQTINNVPTTFDFNDTQSALTVLASKNFAIVEPYLGLGVVTATGDLSANGSTTVFKSTYTGSSQASVRRGGLQGVIGGELKLVVVKLGLEYSRMFDTGRIAGKLSFYF